MVQVRTWNNPLGGQVHCGTAAGLQPTASCWSGLVGPLGAFLHPLHLAPHVLLDRADIVFVPALHLVCVIRNSSKQGLQEQTMSQNLLPLVARHEHIFVADARGSAILA